MTHVHKIYKPGSCTEPVLHWHQSSFPLILPAPPQRAGLSHQAPLLTVCFASNGSPPKPQLYPPSEWVPMRPLTWMPVKEPPWSNSMFQRWLSYGETTLSLNVPMKCHHTIVSVHTEGEMHSLTESDWGVTGFVLCCSYRKNHLALHRLFHLQIYPFFLFFSSSSSSSSPFF